MSSFLSNLQFERTKYKNPDLLKKLDGILFPLCNKSLGNMTVDEVNTELKKAFENRLHRGTAFGNLKLLAKVISNDSIEIDYSLTLADVVKLIVNNNNLIDEKYK